ncbi:MAG: DUF86 domain-containing protein [Planctomycetes bacterium]|nr:DUF86 domain-containing protein [Planctomycetota bacterium]
MSRRDPTASLQDMLDYARKAVRICGDRSQGDFETDEILQLAVVRALELVGEAATRVPQDVRNQHPTIPWQDIVGTRNRLIHGYDCVDVRIVWDTIQDDLPQLIDILRLVLDGD